MRNRSTHWKSKCLRLTAIASLWSASGAYALSENSIDYRVVTPSAEPEPPPVTVVYPSGTTPVFTVSAGQPKLTGENQVFAKIQEDRAEGLCGPGAPCDFEVETGVNESSAPGTQSETAPGGEAPPEGFGRQREVIEM